jgi:hypothetical protein
MSLEGLTKEQIDKFETELLAEVPEATPIGNVTLRGQLVGQGWDEARYWDIRNRLIERGLLQKGGGKGGSVKRVIAEPPEFKHLEPALVLDGAATSQSASVEGREADLYPPMAEVIKTRWAQDYRMDATIVEVTAQQGSKATRGKWTRPDITVAGYRTFPYVPGKHFDLIVFEVKPYKALDVTVVYEALGHRRAANRAYALIHLPDENKEEFESALDEVCSEAKKFGVGVIIASDPNDYDSWEEKVEAVRHEPDPERMNDFLAQQVPQGFREQIIKWFK